MKKIILVFAAIAISASVYAQTDSTNTKKNQWHMNNNQKQNMQNNPVDKSHPDRATDSTNRSMQHKNKDVDKTYHEADSTKRKMDKNNNQYKNEKKQIR